MSDEEIEGERRKGTENDYFGTSHGPRTGRVEGQTPQDARGERPAYEDDDLEEDSCDGDYGDVDVKEELIARINDIPPNELAGIIAAGNVREWSGLLPPPSEYNEYDIETRENIRAWNDAQIIDASRRSDKIADAEIRQGSRDQWLSFVLNVLFVSATFGSFLVTRDPASFGFLAIPTVTLAVNVYNRRR